MKNVMTSWYILQRVLVQSGNLELNVGTDQTLEFVALWHVSRKAPVSSGIARKGGGSSNIKTYSKFCFDIDVRMTNSVSENIFNVMDMSNVKMDLMKIQRSAAIVPGKMDGQ